jgi:hypothetical protein
MTIKLPERKPEAAYARRAIARRRVGPNAKCACGETGPEALIRANKGVICHECKSCPVRQGLRRCVQLPCLPVPAPSSTAQPLPTSLPFGTPGEIIAAHVSQPGTHSPC